MCCGADDAVVVEGRGARPASWQDMARNPRTGSRQFVVALIGRNTLDDA